MKIIRVLVYEGSEEKLKSDLQRRGVKGSRIHGGVDNITITERFAGDDSQVREWLGEAVMSEEDELAGVAASKSGPYAVHCPWCEADAGQPCRRTGGEKVMGLSVHQQRRDFLARALQGSEGATK